MATKIQNISDGLWDDLKIILDYMVIKNNLLATEYETEETRHNAIVYFSAIHHSGPILLYQPYLTYEMMYQIMAGESVTFIEECMANPTLIPEKYQEGILQLVEKKVIGSFVEKNNYYRMLIGLPPIETTEKDYLYLDKETYELLGIKKIEIDGEERYPAIHEMDTLTQDVVEKTDDFLKLKQEYPDDEWLNFIGKNKIPLEQARNAKEFEIIRLFPEFAMDINPELTTSFSNEYNRARDWFVHVMWNADLEGASINYRQFVAFAITIKALRMTLNRQFDGIIENNFLNDTLVTILFNLYRLPASVSQLSKSTRRQLALELRKLIRDRAGNQVLYDIARILGYDGIIISKIVLNKIQLFDGEKQEAVHAKIDSVQDPVSDQSYPVDDPYHSFTRTTQAIDLKTKNIRDDIISQRHIKDYVREVTGPDPRWWEDHNPESDDGIYPSNEEGYLRNRLDDVKRIEFDPKMFSEDILGNPDEDLVTDDPNNHDYDNVYWGLEENERRHPTWYFPGWNNVDTKYMMLTYQYSMAEKIFETIYMMRYLLDKQEQTQAYMNRLDKYGGGKMHSMYDLVLFLVCGINRIAFGKYPYEDFEYGEIINNQTNFRLILGFNVDLTSQELNDYLDRCEYLDVNYVRDLIEETNVMEQDDLKSAYAVGILGLRDYLVTQMEMANTITEWREANKLFDIIFQYDPVRDIHSKPESIVQNKEDGIPEIRYKIYDMEVSLFGEVTGEIGDPVRITIKTLLKNVSESHTITVGFVSAVDENGFVTEVNFRYPNRINDRYALPVWNNPKYNKSNNINLISDTHLDLGDLYNPSGQNGPTIEEGSYPAQVGNTRSTGMYIRVTETWFHTRDLYEKYLDELTQRDPILADYLDGRWDDRELVDRLNEACDLLSEIMDQDLRFLREEINGEDMNNVLMDMIKYIKSYTIDFITSEKKYVLNDKRNPEWIRLIDQIEFDPNKPVTVTTREDLQLYDAIHDQQINQVLYDGKRFPVDETDIDAFTHSGDRFTDRLIKVQPKDGVVYQYEIDETTILEFHLPVDAGRGDSFEDSWTIHNYNGKDFHLPIEIYLGTNPPKGNYYHDSGFTFRTNKLTTEILPIQIAFNHEKMPYKLDPTTVPAYGETLTSENGYIVGKIHCSFVRSDINNPQNK